MSKRPIRVLHVTPYYERAHVYGGPAHSVPLLCQSLVRAGAEVTVLTTDANGKERLDVPLGQPLQSHGVQVHYFRRLVNNNFFWSPGLGRMCKATVAQFDVVHLHAIFVYPTAVGADAAWRTGIPYVVSPRGMLMRRCYARHRWKKAIYMRLFEQRRLSRASAIVCTHEAEAKDLDAFQLGAPRLVVPNGIDTQKYSHLPPRGQFRQRAGVKADAHIVLFAGRLHQVKRPDLAVEAFTRISAQFPRVHLVMAGHDEHRMAATLRDTALAAGCADRVHLVGHLAPDEMLSALSDADLFLMPSETESFGMAAVEAMAAGLPVLLSPHVPLSDQVIAANAGRVAEINALSLASVLGDMLNDAQRLRIMGRHARALVQREFDLRAVADKTLSVYRDLCGKKHPGSNNETASTIHN